MFPLSRLPIVVVVLLTLLLTLAATSQVEPVEGISHQGELSVSVWMGVEPYVASFTVSSMAFPSVYRDFIHFTLDRRAYMYFLDLRPDGEVWLLLNRLLEAGEYHFPSDFLERFTIPGPAGGHLIQVIATLAPLDLGPEGLRIGVDPSVVLNGLQLLIQQRGLGESGWAADWTQFDALPSMPFPPTPNGYLVVCIYEKVDDQEARIRGEFRIAGRGEDIEEKDWESAEQCEPLRMPVGEYILQARSLGFEPDLQNACSIRYEGEQFWRPLDPCIVPISKKSEKIWVKFVFRWPQLKKITFTWSPQEPCVKEQVTFDASASRPKEEILEYLWDFDDLEFPPQRTTNPRIIWAFGQAGIHHVKLTVRFQQEAGRIEEREVTHPVRVFAQGERYPPCHLSPMVAGRAEAGEEDGLKWMKVWNGYVSILQELALPEGVKAGDTVKFKFNYQFKEVPEEGIKNEVIEAYSFVSLFIGETSPLTCYTLLPGRLPDSEARGRPKTVTCGSVILTDTTKPVQVLIVTNVVDKTGASEIPVHVSYMDFQLVSTNPPPDAIPVLCPLARNKGLELNKQPPFYYRHPQYPELQETIVARFHNKCDFPVTLKKWIIREKMSGEAVFEQLNPLTVPPDSFVEWSWDQKDERLEARARGGLAPLCHFYWVELETENGSLAPLIFVIVPLLGSC